MQTLNSKAPASEAETLSCASEAEALAWPQCREKRNTGQKHPRRRTGLFSRVDGPTHQRRRARQQDGFPSHDIMSTSPKTPKNTVENKPRRKNINDSDWGLRRRSFSARCRWLEPSRSKSVSHPTLQTLVVVEESLSKPSSRHRGYTDPATLNDWWANEAHQHWAWEWDFYLEV